MSPVSSSASETSPADADRDAIRRTLAGDCSAYGELVERYEVVLRRVVLGIVADRDLAEDVLQETFFIAYRNLSSFRGEARFGTWLYRIGVREAMRMQTRWTSWCRRFLPLMEREITHLSGRDASADVQYLDEVLSLLNQLPPKQRAAFVLHAVEGKSYEEVAGLLDSCSGTVGSWIHRARARLTKVLRDDAEETVRRPLTLVAMEGRPA